MNKDNNLVNLNNFFVKRSLKQAECADALRAFFIF
jgi:hypothetical protein